MEMVRFATVKEIRKKTQQCQEYNHIQQAAYSTYHDVLTQVCFSCQTVRTNLEEDNDTETEEL